MTGKLARIRMPLGASGIALSGWTRLRGHGVGVGIVTKASVEEEEEEGALMWTAFKSAYR